MGDAVEINVNLDAIDLNTVIGETVAHDEDGEEYDRSGRTLGDEVIAKLVDGLRAGDQYTTLRRRVAEIRDEVIRERIITEVEAAFNKPIRKTNSYGEPNGPETTLTAIIADVAQQWISGRDHSGRTNSAELIKNTVREVLKGDLVAVVNAEKLKAVAAVKAHLAEQLEKASKSVVGL